MDSRDYSTSQHTHSLYPQLYRLQAYLHQDWPDDYPDVWAAIDDFLTGATESDARRLVNEVGSILASTNSEDGLQKRSFGTRAACYCSTTRQAMAIRQKDGSKTCSGMS